jgi:hypothetical protein
MPKKLLLLVPLLTALPLFLTGALRRPTIAPVTPFISEAIPLSPERAGLGAGEVLQGALDRLNPTRVSWLSMKIWQRMHHGESRFESEGTLLLGPEYCARLELTARSGAVPGRWLVVSDGHALAHVIQLGDDAPTVVSGLLVPPHEPGQPAPMPPDVALRSLGCGGPYPLLLDLRARLRELTAQTGRLRGQAVVRIHGRLTGAPPAGGTAGADFCYLYLDAQRLWPSRVEWWAGEKTNPRLLLEMEYREPQLNRPLPYAECIRAFSYRPRSDSDS